jgi:hypothetical protein
MKTKSLIFITLILLGGINAMAQLSVAITSGSTSPTNTNPIVVTITFSGGAPVTGFEESDIIVGNGTKSNFNSTGNPVFTVEINPSTDGDVTADVGSNVCDETNNAATQFSILYDGTNPTVSISSTESDPTNSSIFPITITFSESVTGFASTDISVTNGSVTGASFSGSGTTYSATITPAGQGLVSVNIAANAASDDAGNGNDAATTLTRTYDSVGPTVTITSSASDPTNQSPFPITITFSESVTGFASTDISVTNGSVTGASFSGSGTTYSATITPAGQGLVSVNVAANAAFDDAGNGNDAATTLTRTFDSVGPTVTITSSAGNPTNQSPFPITITFSESVTGFASTDISVTNGSVTGASFSGSGTTYSATITPAGQGLVSVNVAANAAFDDAGNGNDAATTLTRTFDSVGPTVTITSSAGNPTNQSPFPITITFSESVTGFASTDISVTNGSVTGASFSGSGTTYSATITPAGQGLVSVNVAANAASDDAGNGNTAATTLTRTYDSEGPTVTISSVSPNPTNTSPIPITISFNKPVVDFEEGDISVSNGTITASSFSGSGASYSATITPTSQGLVTVNVLAGVATDAAGNGNSAATPLTRTFDSVAPSGYGVSINQSFIFNGNQTGLSFTFSGAEVGTTYSYTISSSGGGTNATGSGSIATSNQTISSINVSGLGDGTLTLNVSLTDVAGNTGSLASNTKIKDVVTLAPTLVAPATGSADNQTLYVEFILPENAQPGSVKMTFTRTGGTTDSKAPHIITFNSNFEFAGTNSTTLDGNVLSNNINVASVSSGAFDRLVDESVYSVTLEYIDQYGNPISSVINTNFAYESNPPVADITDISPDPRNTAVGNIYIAFSRIVRISDVDISDFSLTLNGSSVSLTGLSISNTPDGTYSSYSSSFWVNISTKTTAEGTYVFTLNATGSGIRTRGNSLLVDDASDMWVMDLTPPQLPTVTIQSNYSRPERVGTGGVVTINITANENIFQPTVTIAGGSASVTGSNQNWLATYTMLGAETEGPVTFNIAFRDLANNNGSAVSTTTNFSSVTYDKTAPTISGVEISSSNPISTLAMVGDEITLLFSSNEPIENISAKLNGKNMAVANLGGNNWEATYAMASSNPQGFVTFTLTCFDYSGNQSIKSTTDNSSQVYFDKNKPELLPVTIASNNAFNSSKAIPGDKVTVSFTSNEEITVTSATILGKLATVNNTSGNAWTAEYTVTPTDPEGIVTFTLNFKDLAGNIGNTVLQTSNASKVIVEKTKPILNPVSIGSSNAQSHLAIVGNTVTLSFTSSKGIVVTSANIAGNSATTNGNATGTVWTATTTMLAGNIEGLVNFNLAFRDSAGNIGNPVSTTTNGSTVTFDKLAPTLTFVGIASTNPSPFKVKVGDVVTVTFTASEAIQIPAATIFGRPASVENISGNQWKAFVTALGTDPENQILFNISFADIAGNNGVSVTSTTNGSAVYFDRTKPLPTAVTIASNHTNTSYARVGSTVSLMIHANEDLLNISAAINGVQVAPIFLGGNNWVCNYIPSTNDATGTLPFTINFTDMAGNVGDPVTTTTNSSQVFFDKTRPNFTSIAISTTDPFSPYVKNGSLVQINFTTDEPTENPSIRINNDFATTVTGGPTNWIASRTLGAGEPPTNVFLQLYTYDLAGNESVLATTTTNGSYLIFDNTPPIISAVTVPHGVYKVGDIIVVTITADDDIYSAYNVSVNGKTLPLVNGINNTYLVNYTVSSLDVQHNSANTLPVHIQLIDFAGNFNAPVTTATVVGGSITIDSAIPQIQSVTSNAEGAGKLIIGSQLIFTLMPQIQEMGLNISPQSYNGKPIVWTTTDGSVYTGTYTVVEGDATQATPVQPSAFVITDGAGNTSNSFTYSSIVQPIFATRPTANILGTTTKCDYGQLVPIRFEFNGYPPYQLTYHNGTANVGPFEVNNNFYEISVEKGTYSLVNLIDSNGNNQTTAIQNAIITVVPLPVVTFNISSPVFNITEEPIDLRPYATPAGGTFTGHGVGTNSFFYPGIVGIANEEVNTNVVYTYTNPTTGCTNSDSQIITVSSGSGTLNGINPFYCQYQVPDTIWGTNPSAFPGVFTCTPNLGFLDLGNDHAVIYPQQLPEGSYTVTYTYIKDELQFTLEKVFIVVAVSQTVDFIGLEPKYCENSGSSILIPQNLYPALGTGYFSGPGLSTSSSAVSFNPSLLSPGQTYAISYHYVSQLGGCSTDTILHYTTINPLPQPNFTLRHNYNYSEPPVELTGNYSPEGSFSGPGIFNNNFLRPSDITPGTTFFISYYYKNPETGCENTTVKSSQVLRANETIAGLASEYCYSNDVLEISCSPIFNSAIEGQFFSQKMALTPTGINAATYSVAAAGRGVDTVFFRYSIEGTPYEVFKRVLIDSIGQATITNLQPNYCNDLGLQILVGSTNGGIGSGYGDFTYNGKPEAFGNAGVNAFYTPLLETPGTYQITYTYRSSLSGCNSQTTSSVIINPIPTVRFAISQSCTGTEEPVQFINNTQSTDEIAQWYWNFYELGFSNDVSPSVLYVSPGSKAVSLTATTINGCQVKKDSTINVGVVPKANFAWKNECLTEQATILESTATETNIRTYQWVFDDGTTIEGDGIAYKIVNHLFDIVGSHQVKLVLTSTDNCKDSVTKQLYIQPLIKFNELPSNVYSQNFEAGEAHWLARSLTSNNYLSWEYGQPNGDIISESASGENAWFTAVNYPSTLAERSEVVSPCFNFSSLEKPMLKLNIWSSPETGRDGAVLQYSTNQGLTWEILGEANKGINWYNSTTIQSQPGGSGQFTGWSGIPMASWQSARYKLDVVKGQPNVRFRIVYAAGGGAINYIDGFAFDDFWIGNREQNVLVEYFTNTKVAGTTASNSNMLNLQSNNWRDAITINYHTSNPLNDPVNNLFPLSSPSREFYYGLSAIPYALANGSAPFNFTTFNANQNIIEVESLGDPLMKIDLNCTYNNSVNIEVDIQSLESINNEDLVLLCALVQPVVELPSGDKYYNVVKEFLPNPGGINLPSSWTQGESKSYSFNFTPTSEQVLNNSRVVVFVQNIDTRKVYQSSSKDLWILTSDGITSLEKRINIYPNPSSDYVTIDSPEKIRSISIIDMTGRVLNRSVINNSTTTLPVAWLRSGAYLVSIEFENERVIKRFVRQ